jgi:hypothetical protein
MAENTPVQVDKLTRTYIKIRDKRTELAAKFKAEDDELREQLDLVKEACWTTAKPRRR